MGRKNKKIIQFLLAAAVAAIPLSAQNDGQKENMVRLLQGKSIQIITDEDGKSYRKAVDATSCTTTPTCYATPPTGGWMRISSTPRATSS